MDPLKCEEFFKVTYDITLDDFDGSVNSYGDATLTFLPSCVCSSSWFFILMSC